MNFAPTKIHVNRAMPNKGAVLCHGSTPFSLSLHHQKESPLLYQDIQVITSVERGKFLPYFKEELSPLGKCENEYIENHRHSPWPRINRQPQPIHAKQLDQLSSELWVRSVSLHITPQTRPPASVVLYSNIKLVPQPVTSSYSHKARI